LHQLEQDQHDKLPAPQIKDAKQEGEFTCNEAREFFEWDSSAIEIFLTLLRPLASNTLGKNTFAVKYSPDEQYIRYIDTMVPNSRCSTRENCYRSLEFVLSLTNVNYLTIYGGSIFEPMIIHLSFEMFFHAFSFSSDLVDFNCPSQFRLLYCLIGRYY